MNVTKYSLLNFSMQIIQLSELLFRANIQKTQVSQFSVNTNVVSKQIDLNTFLGVVRESIHVFV